MESMYNEILDDNCIDNENYNFKRQFSFIIKFFHDSIEKHMNNELRKYNLTMVQMGTLIQLNSKKHGLCTLKEMEQTLHLAQSTTAGIIKRLEQKELIVTSIDETDHRNKIVKISEEGCKLCEQASYEMDTLLDGMFNRITEDELHTLIDIMIKLCDK